jgi:2'-5' RNA ligase
MLRLFVGLAMPDGVAARLSLMCAGVGTKARSIHASVLPAAELNHLQAKVESAVVRAGQPPEGRKFIPHVTLAHLHKPQPPRLAAFLEGNAPFQAGPFRVDQFTLYESRRGNGSPVYIPLVDYPLT